MKEDKWAKVPPSKRPKGWELGIEGQIDQTPLDELKKGFGEFGTAATNPIPMTSISSSLSYLNLLLGDFDLPVSILRRGHIRVENIAGPIDMYEVFDVHGNHKCFLYISIYQAKDSEKLPKGFSKWPPYSTDG